MAKYFVKMDELKEKGEELEKYATDIMEVKINELIDIVNKFEWNGPASEEYIKLYKERTSKLLYASKMIYTYGKFMVMAADGYTDVNDQIEKLMETPLIEETKESV